jgi:hypothetical protein
MANPITWRSLQSNPAAGVGGLIQGAERSFNGAFDTLNNQLKEYQQTDADNWKLGKEQNSNVLMDKLASYKTPEELAAAQASGEIQALKAQFGAQYDAGAVREMEGGLQEQLIGRITAQNQYADDGLRRGQRGAMDEIGSLIADKKYAEARGRLGGNEYLDEAPQYAAIAAGERGDAEFKLGQQEKQSSIAANGARISAARESLLSAQETRSRNNTAWKQEQDSNALVNGLTAQYEQARVSGSEAVNKIASDLGVPIVNGVPVTSGLSEYDRNLFSNQIKEAGVDAQSPTELANDLRAKLRKLNVAPGKIASYLQEFDSSVDSTRNLGVTEREDLARFTDQSDKQVTRDVEVANANFADKSKGNMFLQDAPNSLLGIDELISESQKVDTLMWDGTNKDQMIRRMNDLNNKGIDVDGINYPVPPVMLKLAMSVNSDDWTDPSSGIEDTIRDLINENKEQYRESITALRDHADNITGIKASGVQGLTRFNAELQAKNGRGYSVDNLRKNLEATLKR